MMETKPSVKIVFSLRFVFYNNDGLEIFLICTVIVYFFYLNMFRHNHHIMDNINIITPYSFLFIYCVSRYVMRNTVKYTNINSCLRNLTIIFIFKITKTKRWIRNVCNYTKSSSKSKKSTVLKVPKHLCWNFNI